MKLDAAPRVIRYNDEVLPDLNPDEPDVDAIVRMHMTTRPELAAAVVDGPVLADGQRVYTVTSYRGNKG